MALQLWRGVVVVPNYPKSILGGLSTLTAYRKLSIVVAEAYGSWKNTGVHTLFSVRRYEQSDKNNQQN